MLCAVRAFRSLLDTETYKEQLKSVIDDAERNYGFKFTKQYLQDHTAFKLELELIMDELCNAFCSKRWEYQEMVNEEINHFYEEHFDPEILNLTQGEILRVDTNV
jgi:hypothetical protein